MANLLTFRIVSIFTLFVVGVTTIYIPNMYAHINKNSIDFLSYMNLFAAGVFLSIGLMIILPNAEEDLKTLTDKW